ncbi:hypothetical protein [Runella slithyformis]|uniref:DoxX family membrane protein n=1 Tax=Runella slithyformis (strain ATCC 29530 / DSM 19594 / LMG 11500 / NCIMB 11436 / LSU 4) TaxID=761193 RepID=A0A7U4E776_RUNSL|nr:hypothetical protein [Runella slithyformis]AEI50094.1 hypothetical protein Runsl_3736 [Runella slithyformis DSM 19594]
MTFKDFNVLLIRLFLGYVFTSSGLCKLTEGHFGQLIGPPLLIEQLTPHGLRTFGFFIAVSQVTVGALVLSQRYAVLGLIMLVPMNVGILMVTISQHWRGTPYVDAVFTTLNVLALLYEWPALKFLLLPEHTTIQLPLTTNRLFPGRTLPLMIIGFFGICCITSRYEIYLTSTLATVGYGLAFYHVFRSQRLPPLYRLVLILAFFSILGMTWISLLHKLMPFNPFFLITIPTLGTAFMYLLTIGWALFFKKRLIKNI